jgi:hypothetical protein
MAFNLIRNSRVFFTTNVNALGVVQTAGGFDATNTREIQVLDGFSFTQNTTAQTITLAEAGAAPVRGQRSFNTALEPVDFSMSTYIRPDVVSGDVAAEESVLWNALASAAAIGANNAAWVAGESSSTVSFAHSNVHQLQAFGLLILIDNVCYVIDNAALDSATIDFGIDAIGTIAWAGKGTALRQLSGVSATQGSSVTFTGLGVGSAAKGKETTARYIANKLSVLEISSVALNRTYTVALTGGSITISNNLTYLTPANLGVVNQPITYFTGTRAVSGSLTAYLRTGTNTSATLLQDFLANVNTASETKYTISLAMGGAATPNRVELDLPLAMLSVPTVSSEQVISTTINFTAQGSTSTTYDLEQTNELTVTYIAAE